MKKFIYLFGLIIVGILINFGITNPITATTYVCQENGCTTTINEYEGGYNWSILCDDGSHSSGNVEGGEYGGDCPVVTPQEY